MFFPEAFTCETLPGLSPQETGCFLHQDTTVTTHDMQLVANLAKLTRVGSGGSGGEVGGVKPLPPGAD